LLDGNRPAGAFAADGLACVTSGLPAAVLALALGPGMLVIGGVLAGLCYLAALADGKRARLAARYTETLSADLRAHGELTAYREIAVSSAWGLRRRSWRC
jgi:hypothetical protein